MSSWDKWLFSPQLETRRKLLAVLSHEGTYPVIYSTWPFPIGTTHRTGYLARPDKAGQFPVVVVLPAVKGLTSFEKDLCWRLARHGIVGISIDLYRQLSDPLDAYAALADSRALTDLDELHEFVLSEDVDWAQTDGIGVFGTDVGGRFALMAASRRDWVRSIVVAYTPLTGDEDREFQVASALGNLPIPVLAFYGTDDELIDVSSVDEAQRRNDHGQWLLYSGLKHGFLDADDANFDQSGTDDAMARMLAFFKATLPDPAEIDLG